MKATGDVCERCRRQRKRAKRSGSGRNLAKRTASEKISGTATGIARRIDDLGRVVIPKEIRRTMRIREGGLGCRLGRASATQRCPQDTRTPSQITLTPFDRFFWAIHSVINRHKGTSE